LEHAALGIRDIAIKQSGKITLACVPSAAYYFLPPVLRTFGDLYPGIQLRIIDESEEVVLQSLMASEADFGIGFMGTRVPEIDFEPLLADAFVLVVPLAHPLAHRRAVSWEELQGERLMTVARTSGNRQLIDDALARCGLRPTMSCEVSRVSTLAGMVEAGLGVAVMPQLSLPSASHPALTGIPLREPAITRTLGIMLRHGRALHPQAGILHAMLREAFLARKGSNRSAPARGG
jgi:DNA-binding transcriptional LysR family regulator